MNSRMLCCAAAIAATVGTAAPLAHATRDSAMGKGMHTFSVDSLKMVAGTCGS